MASHSSLPFFPAWLTAGREENFPAVMRPFGRAVGDLEVEFYRARRPDIITDLLSRCCEGGNAERAVEEIPVGMRIEALLALASLADSRPFSWRMRCVAAGCGLESEFELALDPLIALGDEQRSQRTVNAVIGGLEATLRRPTARDQHEWLAAPRVEPESMLRALLVSPRLEEMLAAGVDLETIAVAVDEIMEQFDPLVGFHLGVVCPFCGCSNDVSPDLAELALERLARAQDAAIEDVHNLASRYHWSETQVLQLPEWRRRRYLELIREEA